MIDIKSLLRKSVLTLKPYSTARDEFKGKAEVFLDANENPYLPPYNRYPDPRQEQLKQLIAATKGVKQSQLFLGNGSDEAIDLLIRIFCEPNKDSVMITEPTYGMYSVCASVNSVKVINAPLDAKFDLDPGAVRKAAARRTKLLFLASPNNPTANSLSRERVMEVIKTFKGIVVIDEAYIDFSAGKGFLGELSKHKNLVVLQTFSKAWGLAGARLGMCFADELIINTLNKVKYPYNINSLTQEIVTLTLREKPEIQTFIENILEQRKWLVENLDGLTCIKEIFPSDANFILVRFENGPGAYRYLLDNSIIVRDRSGSPRCENCLRITVGTPQENLQLIKALKRYDESSVS